MKENQVMVESCADCTISLDAPEFHISRVWSKRGAKYPFDRELLEQLFYQPGIEALFFQGYLKCNDKEFMKDMGLMSEDETPVVVELTDVFMKRMIGVMPMKEFKDNLAKLQPNQIMDLTDYAIEHSSDLKIDKAEILSKMTGKQVMRAIEYARAEEAEAAMAAKESRQEG